MIRYTVFIAAVIATAATALAAVSPTPMTTPLTNVTVIEQNSPFPVLGPLVFEECAVEDCSDTPQ